MSNVDAIGKAGFGHRHQSPSARQSATRKGVLDGIVCKVVAGAALLFVAAIVVGLIGH